MVVAGRDARIWLTVTRRWVAGWRRFAWSDPQGPDGGRYWTDGWDGYAPARQRLLAPIAEKRLGGAVVLGGDVHAHYVADLKADFGDPKSATLATRSKGPK